MQLKKDAAVPRKSLKKIIDLIFKAENQNDRRLLMW